MFGIGVIFKLLFITQEIDRLFQSKFLKAINYIIEKVYSI